jgi:D-alanyl-D-alanine carboxypeptidase
MSASPGKIRNVLGSPSGYAASRGLKPQREARRLVSVGPAPDDGQFVRLTPPTAAAWRRMRAAAAGAGIVLLPLSGFRSVARQTALIRKKLAAGQSLESILEFVTAPGFSEHHTGRALDIGSPDDVGLDEKFGNTAAFRWLRHRAGEFGFHLSFPRGNRHGIGYEPWHWCWRRTT